MDTVKRNPSGSLNLRSLRAFLAERRAYVYRQGGNWISSVWSDSFAAFIERRLHYSIETERQALESVATGFGVYGDEGQS